jgi:hypothetical protein
LFIHQFLQRFHPWRELSHLGINCCLLRYNMVIPHKPFIAKLPHTSQTIDFMLNSCMFLNTDGFRNFSTFS